MKWYAHVNQKETSQDLCIAEFLRGKIDQRSNVLVSFWKNLSSEKLFIEGIIDLKKKTMQMRKTKLISGLDNCGSRVICIHFSPVEKYVLEKELFA